jgi:hypothetical protein
MDLRTYGRLGEIGAIKGIENSVLPLDTVENSLRAFDISNGVSSPIFQRFILPATWDGALLTQVAQ